MPENTPPPSLRSSTYLHTKQKLLSKSTGWKVSLLSLIFFQFVFVFVLVRYYSAIIIVPGQNISYEYWDWWLSQSKPYFDIAYTVDGTAKLFQMLFGTEILVLFWKNRRGKHIFIAAAGVPLLVSSLLFGWRHYCIPHLLHYRIFMDLIPGEILALGLLLVLMLDSNQAK